MDTDKHRWGTEVSAEWGQANRSGGFLESKANRPLSNGSMVIWALALSLLMVGCGVKTSQKHKETVNSGVLVIPQADQLIKLYPNFPKHHAITHFGFDESKPVRWNTLVYIHERYTLHFTVDVVVDYDKNTVTSMVGNEEFFLFETTGFSREGNAVIGEQWRFGVNDWIKVVAANGDLTQIGIVLKTNAPYRAGRNSWQARNDCWELKAPKDCCVCGDLSRLEEWIRRLWRTVLLRW